ncbi:MAG TPA: zf-HC2 domain-containing protein, partial [Ktedonobacteraceae bacterium]|nr:zf-HC2 domain-containing protein [Ktedonobacteraceae bacterium]
MNCEQVKEHLSAYLDSMLAQDEAAQVEAHTKVCPGCSSALADVGYFDSLLANLPRIAPDESVREKLFSSAAYRELTGTYGRTRLNGHAAPRQPLRRHDRPLLVALPGGRSTTGSDSIAIFPRSSHKRRVPVQLRILRLFIAASFLLTLGVGGFIGWQWRQKADHGSPTISTTTPPSGAAQGPIPAGIRFVFLRGGSLWSAPSDGGTGIMRMTPTSTVVADNWTIRPALPGRPAGNMLAYIDIQQGFVHIIRSDGQNDIAIPQPLLKQGTIPTSVWDTKTGAIILNSLSWSKDGSMLAFVTEDGNMDQTRLYIYTVNTHSVSAVALPVKGEIADPIWSPDSIRVAFTCTHDGRASILDYNTRNHGVLTIASAVNTTAHLNESILTLDWSPNSTIPALTWSVGTIGQVHSIWLQRVGAASELTPRALTLGNYVQAIYSQAGNGGAGSWLLISTRSGLPGDIETVDLTGNRRHLTDD